MKILRHFEADGYRAAEIEWGILWWKKRAWFFQGPRDCTTWYDRDGRSAGMHVDYLLTFGLARPDKSEAFKGAFPEQYRGRP